jgi:RHS repeat-associated protein
MKSSQWLKAVLMMCLVSSGNTAFAMVRDAVYNHDTLNRIDTVVSAGGITDYDYDRAGLKTKVSYPNGSNATYTYDNARRISTITNKQGVALVSSYSYSYDSNGNRTQQIETNGGAAEPTTYVYDGNDRLTETAYPDAVVTYSYDAAYNRLTETAVDTASVAMLVNKTYTYNTRNQLTGITDNLNAANNVIYQYDANGNPVLKNQTGISTTFLYDVRDQLLTVREGTVTLGTYGYDYQGLRTSKTDTGGTRRNSYDGDSVLLQTDATGATLAKYAYGPDQLISLDHTTEGQQYYLFDAQGTVVDLTKPDGTLQARYQYDAWGNTRAQTGTSANPFGYTGHEKDDATGLYYFKARYYDTSLGRFLTQDAYLGDINTPPSLHRYLYAYANPTVYVDLDGNKSIFGGATDQIENFKDWLGEQNKASDSQLASVAIGTAQFVASLGEGITRPLDIAANLAQVATGVDDQQVRDELAGTKKFVTDAADFVVNGDYAQAVKNVHQAAVAETVKAMSGDVTATSNVTQAVLGVALLKSGTKGKPTITKENPAGPGAVVQREALTQQRITNDVVADTKTERVEFNAGVAKNTPYIPVAGEDLYVGLYGQSRRANIKSGLNATHTPHHVVQNAVSEKSHSLGVTINIRKDLHEYTRTYGRNADLGDNVKNLAADIRDLRNVLRDAGYDRSLVNQQLRELIQLNRQVGNVPK